MSMKITQLERVSARRGMDRRWLNFPIHTDTDGNERQTDGFTLADVAPAPRVR